MKYKVIFSHSVIKSLLKMPPQIRKKIIFWTEQIEMKGLSEVRKIPGYHDEVLRGQRQGERSVRLSRGYRAIYREEKNENLYVIKVLEAHKHDY